MRMLASVLTVAMLVMTFMLTLAPYAGAAVVEPSQSAQFSQTDMDHYTSQALNAGNLQMATGGQWYNPNTWNTWVWIGVAAVVVVVVLGACWAADVF